MPLDVLEPDLIGLAQNGIASAVPRHPDAQALKFDLIVKVLQRDDPLRRSYLQRRWHSQAVSRGNIVRTSSSAIAFSRQ
jgi:hypothetical protein